MSATTKKQTRDPALLASYGKDAIEAKNYDEAVSYYTQAISYKPDSPQFHIQRSICHQRLQQYQEAVNDAEMALYLADKLGKRELKAAAQFRRGIGYFFLGQLGDAKFCLELSKKLNPNEKMLSIWLPKVEMALSKCEEDDDKRKRVTVGEMLNLADKVQKPIETTAKPMPVNTTTATPTPAAPKAIGVTMPVDKIREEWIQSNSHVTFTLYVKGVPKDQAVVTFEPHSFSITFPLANGSEYSCDKDPLYGEIDTTASTYSVLGTKVELRLKKKTENVKWATLESKNAPLPTTTAEPSTPVVVPTPQKAPSYPTSSKNGPKNWDKLATELVDTKGEDGVDDEEGDPVNNLFKQIYAGADEDTKRAMMKSFVESNGTALSTNWDEVGKKKMPVTPPEGMVAKEWEK